MPGQDKLTLPGWNCSGLDEDDLTTYRRPGQSGGDTRAVNTLGCLLEEALPAQVFGNLVRRDVDRGWFALSNLRCYLAAQRTDLALKITHSGLARVITLNTSPSLICY